MTTFKITRLHSENDSESDYETAVDMSHWSCHRRVIDMETPYGLHLSLVYMYEHTTHSYLEPDWDVLEATGEVTYDRHSDRSKDSERITYRLEGSLPLRMPLLTQASFALMDKNSRQEGEGLGDAEDEYLSCKAGYLDHPLCLCDNHEWVAQLLASLDILPLKKGMVAKTQLHPELEECIAAFEKEMAAIRWANLQANIHNACEEALYQIGRKAEQYKAELTFF